MVIEKLKMEQYSNVPSFYIDFKSFYIDFKMYIEILKNLLYNFQKSSNEVMLMFIKYFSYINSEIIINIAKMLFVVLFTYLTNLKILNKKITTNNTLIFNILCIILISIISGIIRYKVNYLVSLVILILIISVIFFRDNIGKNMITTVISLSINYIIYLIAIMLCFILNKIVKVNNDIANFFIMQMIHIAILCALFKMKRFKYGISFLKKDEQNDHIDILILNISVTILFSIILLVDSNMILSRAVAPEIFTLALLMFITIQKSLQLYYKQKLLVKELDETKKELENTKKELKQVEEENLNFSKKSHTLAHRQKSLEHKIEELTAKAEITTEEAGEVKDRLKEIERDLYKETATVELSKTEIPEIDDMLKYMQSECIKNKIEFELQLTGNIHHMTNNLISKEDLEILLADHIKDAIIAINHSDNINRSILVRLGEIDGIYSLYIYDSGIEFEKETLENLGKKPSTTHADEGGTGMGFMNTFDTLKKYEASLIINELDKPNKDNYTKVLIFKFDKKNEFKIISYRQ